MGVECVFFVKSTPPPTPLLDSPHYVNLHICFYLPHTRDVKGLCIAKKYKQGVFSLLLPNPGTTAGVFSRSSQFQQLRTTPMYVPVLEEVVVTTWFIRDSCSTGVQGLAFQTHSVTLNIPKFRKCILCSFLYMFYEKTMEL